jgi:hypothetical protein
MLLSEFWTLVDMVLSNATAAYTVTNAAYVIDDPSMKVSLFQIFFGFVVLEFFLVVLNSLRGSGYSQGIFDSDEQISLKNKIRRK